MGRPAASSVSVATPQRLLDAAEAAFAVTGFAGAKLAAIATHAGIRRPSLLYHFKNKETLYEAVVERAFERLGEVLTEARTSEGTFRHRLRRLLQAYVDFLDGQPHLAKILLRQITEGDAPGQSILIKQVGPLLDDVERFIQREGGDQIRPVPIRPAVVQLCANVLVRASAGSQLRAHLWGEQRDDAWALTEAMFLVPDGAAQPAPTDRSEENEPC